ncbi:MAG: thermonuclease family protein [Kofleriaceae bacterium]
MRTLVTFVVLGWLALLGLPAAADPAAAGVGFGDYKLDRVVDGDTVRVEGLDSSLRLLGIDTEETFKHAKERRAYAKGWASYVQAARGASPRPAKFATPLGDVAKTWAEAWFAGVDRVRLERDDPHEIRDRYHRYLAYVLVEKHGTWLNYNVEAVRAGMSPYFPKYGRSRRYDHDFITAEAEAKAAHRGIWAPGAEAYPDYPEREAWWTARGDFVAAFRTAAAGAQRPRFIDLTHDDAATELEALVGRGVSVLGTVGEIEPGAPVAGIRTRGRSPTRVLLDHHIALVFFDPEVVAASGIAAWKGEWIRVTGTPSLYKSRLQIVIDRADQIELSAVPGLTKPTATAAAKPPRNRTHDVSIPAP